MNRYRTLLLLAFAAVWRWATIEPSCRHNWLLENSLAFIFVPVILLTGCYFRPSDQSYTLIPVFMVLYVIGSHYAYAEAPFGYDLQRWFGASGSADDHAAAVSSRVASQ